jgi:hypothetical protein
MESLMTLAITGTECINNEHTNFLIYIYTSRSTRRCPRNFNITCVTYWKTMVLQFHITYRFSMLENALRSLPLFNLLMSWHFNITTLMNPSVESFEPRYEQDHFSYEKTVICTDSLDRTLTVVLRRWERVPIPSPKVKICGREVALDSDAARRFKSQRRILQKSDGILQNFSKSSGGNLPLLLGRTNPVRTFPRT